MLLDNLITITNLCTCITENGEELTYCDGSCWDTATDMFDMDLDEWFMPGEYRIEGFPTWHGPVAGLFDATTTMEFLRAITPNRTDWNLQYELPVEGQPFSGIISHHDGGGRIIVTYLPDSGE